MSNIGWLTKQAKQRLAQLQSVQRRFPLARQVKVGTTPHGVDRTVMVAPGPYDWADEVAVIEVDLPAEELVFSGMTNGTYLVPCTTLHGDGIVPIDPITVYVDRFIHVGAAVRVVEASEDPLRSAFLAALLAALPKEGTNAQ